MSRPVDIGFHRRCLLGLRFDYLRSVYYWFMYFWLMYFWFMSFWYLHGGFLDLGSTVFDDGDERCGEDALFAIALAVDPFIVDMFQ